MARANPRRVVVAQLTGVAAAVAQVRRITEEEGMVELSAELAALKVKLGTRGAAELLTEAASLYATTDPALEEWWYPNAFAFLVKAGADPEAARTQWAARRA